MSLIFNGGHADPDGLRVFVKDDRSLSFKTPVGIDASISQEQMCSWATELLSLVDTSKVSHLSIYARTLCFTTFRLGREFSMRTIHIPHRRLFTTEMERAALGMIERNLTHHELNGVRFREDGAVILINYWLENADLIPGDNRFEFLKWVASMRQTWLSGGWFKVETVGTSSLAARKLSLGERIKSLLPFGRRAEAQGCALLADPKRFPGIEACLRPVPHWTELDGLLASPTSDVCKSTWSRELCTSFGQYDVINVAPRLLKAEGAELEPHRVIQGDKVVRVKDCLLWTPLPARLDTEVLDAFSAALAGEMWKGEFAKVGVAESGLHLASYFPTYLIPYEKTGGHLVKAFGLIKLFEKLLKERAAWPLRNTRYSECLPDFVHLLGAGGVTALLGARSRLLFKAPLAKDIDDSGFESLAALYHAVTILPQSQRIVLSSALRKDLDGAFDANLLSDHVLNVGSSISVSSLNGRALKVGTLDRAITVLQKRAERRMDC